MSYTSIPAADIEVGKPVKKSLMETIKTNLDDHESRIAALSSSANRIPIFEYNLDPKDLHIGEIRTADMTLTEFQAVNGTGWILCDGASCTGSVYAAITGHSVVPDLQDEFLRGASGSRTLGSTQADATAVNGLSGAANGGHSHTYYHGVDNTGPDDGVSIPGSGKGRSNASTSSVANHSHTLTGDSETRPQNYAVNFFIKINLSAQDNVINLKAREDMTIVNVVAYVIDNNGLPTSGNLEFDIKKGATRAALSTVFLTKPTLTYAATADGDATSSGTFLAGGADVTAGQWLTLDVTSYMAGQSGIYVQVFAEPA